MPIRLAYDYTIYLKDTRKNQEYVKLGMMCDDEKNLSSCHLKMLFSYRKSHCEEIISHNPPVYSAMMVRKKTGLSGFFTKDATRYFSTQEIYDLAKEYLDEDEAHQKKYTAWINRLIK